MESLQEIKQLITDAKNICVIPSQGTSLHPASQLNEPESLTAALALFYTLKELGKNVNLIIDQVPENLQFLIPSTDFISKPKNFVISIPKNVAEISQVYYEKNEDNLKIHLTIEKGAIKKDNISFYFSDAKPDVVIALGIKDFRKELESKLDSFGFLLDSPIVNIDTSAPLSAGNQSENTRFGKINIVEEKSLSEIVLEITKSLSENPISKNTAHTLLTGLTLHYQNFQNPKTTPEVFELCATLMKLGANRQQIIEHLYKANYPGAPTPFKQSDQPIHVVTS